ncbi:MAG: ABC-F family ATP-binding cassette domain-containing protein [Hyphomicrobiales bacterium]
MQAPVSLSSLCWSTPDGTRLFNNLDIAFGPGRTGLVGRNGTGKTTLLRLIAGELSPMAGEVRIAGTLALLRQTPLVRPGETIADLFGAGSALALLRRVEAGRAGAEDLPDADWTLPHRIGAALRQCGLETEPETLLGALSGGQRARAHLAAQLFMSPDVLLLDEPSNNLDDAGRRLVATIVRNWTGTVIIASHDRTLLAEVDAVVELTRLGATRYGGNYAHYRERKEQDLAAARHDLADAEKADAEAARRAREAAERKARRDSRGKKARAKGDQPKILMDAARERAEASGGANVRLRGERRAATGLAVAAARTRLEVLQPLRMTLPECGLPQGRTILSLDAVSAGYVAGQPLIRNLSLTIAGPRRIAIRGANGSGKTTLMRLIAGAIAPFSGTVERVGPVAYLDQDVGFLDADGTLLENFGKAGRRSGDREAHAVLARFGFRAGEAKRLAGGLSGGERLRAGLACVLGKTPTPSLLMLDEPTNHLDLDSIEMLEAALAGYDGALLVVSHDETFLDALRLDGTIDLPDGRLPCRAHERH